VASGDRLDRRSAGAEVSPSAERNSELEAPWNASLRELTESRARLVAAFDRERRKLERDLHDGVQQRLMGIRIKLRMTGERVEDTELAARLEAIGTDVDSVVEELRTLVCGIYPPVLSTYGLADALRSFAIRARIPIVVDDEGIGRCASPVEAAIYSCSTEAVQNVVEHRETGARVTITLGRDRRRLRFAIAGDGVGVETPGAAGGDRLTVMRDRIDAVGGLLEIASSPGQGTTVRGSVPLFGSGPLADEAEDL
jgi:signal transduction histidine kinase